MILSYEPIPGSILVETNRGLVRNKEKTHKTRWDLNSQPSTPETDALPFRLEIDDTHGVGMHNAVGNLHDGRFTLRMNMNKIVLSKCMAYKVSLDWGCLKLTYAPVTASESPRIHGF